MPNIHLNLKLFSVEGGSLTNIGKSNLKINGFALQYSSKGFEISYVSPIPKSVLKLPNEILSFGSLVLIAPASKNRYESIELKTGILFNINEQNAALAIIDQKFCLLNLKLTDLSYLGQSIQPNQAIPLSRGMSFDIGETTLIVVEQILENWRCPLS